MDTQVNKRISDDAIDIYFAKVKEQCATHTTVIGNITNEEDLRINLGENAIPESIFAMTYENYDEFLSMRRKLMADTIRKYYKNL